MPKLSLSDVVNLGGNPVSAQQVINQNSDRIEQAVEKTLSRDGSKPNHMESDFDMNHYRILNLPDAKSCHEPVTLCQVSELVGALSNGDYAVLDNETVLRNFDVSDKVSGTTVILRRSYPGADTGWGIWVLKDNPSLAVNDVTVIPAKPSRFWEKIAGDLDAASVRNYFASPFPASLTPQGWTAARSGVFNSELKPGFGAWRSSILLSATPGMNYLANNAPSVAPGTYTFTVYVDPATSAIDPSAVILTLTHGSTIVTRSLSDVDVNNRLQITYTNSGTHNRVIRLGVGAVGTGSHTGSVNVTGWRLEQGSDPKHVQSIAPIQIKVPGDRPTISAALDYLGKFSISKGFLADVLLEPLFVMREQVWIDARNFGFCTIFAKDPVVSIDTSYLTQNRTQDIYGMISRAAFTIVQGGTSPRIGCTFDMGSPGNASQRQYGFLVAGPGSTGSLMNFRGFKNSGSIGIYANRGGYINAYGADVSNAGTIGIYANRARINCHNVNASGAGLYGIAAIYSSEMSAYGAKAENCGKYGIYANFSSTINANSTLFEDDPDPEAAGVTSVSGSQFGFRASGNSRIHADGALANNCTKRGVWVEGSSVFNHRDGQAKDCVEHNVFCGRASIYEGWNTNLSGGVNSITVAQASTANIQDSNCDAGIICLLGSTVNANGSTGALNITKNTVTPSGIIFKV